MANSAMTESRRRRILRTAVKIKSNPPQFGAIAQLGERIVRNDEVVGSIPTSSTKIFNELATISAISVTFKNCSYWTVLDRDFYHGSFGPGVVRLL